MDTKRPLVSQRLKTIFKKRSSENVRYLVIIEIQFIHKKNI